MFKALALLLIVNFKLADVVYNYFVSTKRTLFAAEMYLHCEIFKNVITRKTEMDG
jgi:hypothetical protein